MAERNRVGAYQHFLHDQPEDLLAYGASSVSARSRKFA
jgi:hypothetical protein